MSIIAHSKMTFELNHENGALAHLAKIDDDIAKALKSYGPPPDRSEEPGFATLARTIIGQQISTKAAASVWKRMAEKKYNEEKFANQATITELRQVGLSERKAEYIKGLAKAIIDGDLDIGNLNQYQGDEITKKLTAIRGIGEWTADNYRLFVLADMDAWPFNDLALQEGAKILKQLSERPDGKTLKKMGEVWRPYRGAAALMLWHIYAQYHHKATIADI